MLFTVYVGGKTTVPQLMWQIIEHNPHFIESKTLAYLFSVLGP